MTELTIRDFFIVNEYGVIGVALSMFCFVLILEFMGKDRKMNWKIVFLNTVGTTITVYIFNAIVVLCKAVF